MPPQTAGALPRLASSLSLLSPFLRLNVCPSNRGRLTCGMDRLEREELIRGRFKALGGVLHPRSYTPRPKAPARLPQARNSWVSFLTVNGPVQEWIQLSDQ